MPRQDPWSYDVASWSVLENGCADNQMAETINAIDMAIMIGRVAASQKIAS